MFDKLVAGLVTTYLGKYFENVNKEQVQVSLWGGYVQLRNLRFRKDALRAWDTAVCVKEGSIDELVVVIPWTRLQSECVVVTVKRVRLVLQQKTVAGYDPVREKKEAYERRLHQLDIFDALLRQGELVGEGGDTSLGSSSTIPMEGAEEVSACVEAQKDATFSARLKANILNNVRLEVEDVALRYEGSCNFGRNVGVGDSVLHTDCETHCILVALDRFHTHACNENYEPHFSAATERVLYKQVILEGMRVLLETANGSVEGSKVSIDGTNEISELSNLSSSLRQPSTRVGHGCIVSPFGAVAHIQYQPVPYRVDLPTARVDFHLDNLRTALSYEECITLRSLWCEVCNGEEFDALRRFRPVGEGKRRPTDDAQAWWKYAIQATLHRVRRVRERRVFVWESYKRTKMEREEYMMLFQRARREHLCANWLVALTSEEIQRMQELEMDLPIESVKLARRLAYHRTCLERQHHNTMLEKRRQQQQRRGLFLRKGSNVIFPSAPVAGGESGGWWSWGVFSRFWRADDNACDTTHDNNSEFREEVEQMLQLVHAERWTAAQRLVIAKEFGIPENEVEDLTDAGNFSSKISSDGGWKVNLCVRLFDLTLCHGGGRAGVPFTSMVLRGLSADLAQASNRCFDFAIRVDGSSILSHEQEEVEGGEMKEAVEIKKKTQHGVEILRVESWCRAASNGTSSQSTAEAAEEWCDDGGAAMSLSLKHLYPSNCTEYDSGMTVAPYKLRMYCGKVDCNLNISFLRACLDFSLNSALSHNCLGVVSSSAIRTTTIEAQTHNMGRNRGKSSDLKMQRMELMMAVEKEFICDWKLVFRELRIVLATTTATAVTMGINKSEEWQQASRISLRHVVVVNDSEKKLERRRRIQRVTESGDNLCDWVNNVHVCVDRVMLDTLAMTPRKVPSSAVDDDNEQQWESITAISRLTIHLGKSLLMRRIPGVAFLATSVEMGDPVCFYCSRQNLSILCNVVSQITDFFQAAGELVVTHESSSSDDSVMFLAHLCVVDDRYLVEHEPLEKPSPNLFYSACAKVDNMLNVPCRIKVLQGCLTLYHAARPNIPSHFFELQRQHLHIVRDVEKVSIFVERGGFPHEYRSGVLEAKRVLFSKYKFPRLESMVLLEALVEEWCQQHEDGMWKDAVVEVKKSLHVVQSASCTRPCRHVCIGFDNEEMAQRFIDVLKSHTVVDRVFGISPHCLSEEEDSCIFSLDMNIPQCTLVLLDEALVHRGDSASTPPATHKMTFTSMKLSCIQHKRKKIFNVFACGFSLLAHSVALPVVDVGRADSASSADPVIKLSFQMEERQWPHAARKHFDINLSSTVRLLFSSELLSAVEMLWDIMGILTSQIFGLVVHYCYPWCNTPAITVEENWRCNGVGGLLQLHLVSISMRHLVLSIYYPSDGFGSVARGSDGDASAVKCGRKPLVMVEGSQVVLRWSNSTGCSETYCGLQRPSVALMHAPSGEYRQMIRPACIDDKKEEHGAFPRLPSVSLSFVIHREPPMLSRSDYICNGGPAGYRYTQFFTLAGDYLDIVYNHPQLWTLLEVCTRGVISRAISLVCRPPYNAGEPLVPCWSELNTPILPFSWQLLRKKLDLSHVQLTLPLGEDAVHLWGAADRICFHDELLVNGGGRLSSGKHCVQQVSTMRMEGIELFCLPYKCDPLPSGSYSHGSSSSRVTLMSRTNFLFDFSSELFRAGGWPEQRPRCFRICVSDPIVFQGSTHQFAIFLEWLDANYFSTSWKAHFPPNVAAVDPFLLSACNPDESTIWTVDVHYLCLRLMDPVQEYCCVTGKGSCRKFERTVIDMAVVIERLAVDLQWGPRGAFVAHYNVGEIGVWQLGHHVESFVLLLRHPSEIVHESFRFIWLHHNTVVPSTQMAFGDDEKNAGGVTSCSADKSRKNPQMALQMAYSVKTNDGKRDVSCYITVDGLDVTLVPSFLYNLRDSLFSLRVRNSIAGILHWDPHVPGVLPRPLDLELQDGIENRRFSFPLVNVTLPRFSHSCKQVAPLFLVSFLGTEYEYSATSSTHGVDYAWSFSVDCIARNGIVVDDDASDTKSTLRPIIFPYLAAGQQQQCGEMSSPLSSCESSKKLLVVTKTTYDGLVGSFTSLWIVLPLKREILALHEVLVRGGYVELRWLTTFLEERWAWRSGTLYCSGHETSFSVHIVIHLPHVVVLEHESVLACNLKLGRGMVFDFGKAEISRDVNSPEELRFLLHDVHVKSLGEGSHYVVKPFNLRIFTLFHPDKSLELEAHIDAIDVHVEQSLYELMLHSVVRHFVATEAELLELAAVSEAGMEVGKRSFPLNLDFISLPMGGEDNTTTTAAVDATTIAEASFASSSSQLRGLTVWVECDFFTLRVSRDALGIFASVGTMRVVYDRPVTNTALDPDAAVKKGTVQLCLASVALGVDDAPHLLDLQPHPCPPSDDEEVVTSDLVSSQTGHCISLRMHTHVLEEEVHVDFGKVVVFLEKNTMLSLLSMIYEPYRRIVLPEYRVQEVKYVENNIQLQERLILSKRTKLHVARRRYNHITIDGSGHDIHFIDAGSPLLSLEEGLTLRIINARIHLYGRALRYYITVGEGSYVVADAACNTIIGDTQRRSSDVKGISNTLEPAVVSSLNNGDTCRASSLVSTLGGGGDGGNSAVCNDSQNPVCSRVGMTAVITTSPLHSNKATRRVFANAVLLLTLPDGTHESQVQPGRTPQPSRSLVLAATMSSHVEIVQRGERIERSSTFDLKEFTMRCEYLDTEGSVIDTSPLVSEWPLTLRTQAQGWRNGALERRMEVVSPRGMEIRLRCDDVSFCWRAVLQVQRALGHFETNVLNGMASEHSPSSPMTPHFRNVSVGTSRVEGKNSISFHMRYFCLDVVDDSTNVDIPLFRIRVENPSTSTAVIDASVHMLHIPCVCSIMYYDFSSSSWFPLLEPVVLDVAIRWEPNFSLEDVKQRKGSLRVGLHLRAMRIHFSTIVAENVRRIWLLKERLENTLLEQERNVRETSTAPSKMQFYSYKVAQYLGHGLHVQFAHDDRNRFPLPCTLTTEETLQFNFPRVEGHELPVSQHCILVTFRHMTNIVNIAKVGKSLIHLGHGIMSTHVLMDVSTVEGQKRVAFRTNVTFRNDLPFSMDVGNVGVIQPNGVLHVPIDCLRSRTLFTPFTGWNCVSPCSLGVSYDMLPHLYEQVFLGVCTLDCRKKIEVGDSTLPLSTPVVPSLRDVYFLLRFASKSCVGDSGLLDCVGNFEAPFFITNGTCLPIRVSLLNRGKSTKRRGILNFSNKNNHYEHVATIDIAPEERFPITQINPLTDVYVEVLIVQANGEVMKQTCDLDDKQQSPVLVHSPKKQGRQSTITLRDANGASVVLHVDYTMQTVTIWCPYWIINRTPYHLQVSDVKKGVPVAGLRGEEGIAPGRGGNSGGNISSSGSVIYLVNTPRMDKMKEKSFLYICIGQYSSSGTLKWTKWSDQVFTGILSERSVVCCTLSKTVDMMLSYTVHFVGGRVKATRVVTFSPSWIVENSLDRPISFRQCSFSAEKRGNPWGSNSDRKQKNNSNNNLLLSPVTVNPDERHILSLCGVNNSSNAIQICMLDNEEAGIRSCQWSRPLSIDKLDDRAFNLSFETRITAEDHCDTLIAESIARIGDKAHITRPESTVLMLSCFRRGSIIYILISKPERPPYVIENRTAFTVLAQQRGVPHRVVVYPRTTCGFALEDSTSQPVMELWAEGRGVKGKPVFINFEPRAVLKRSEQLQQKIYFPGGIVLFVQVRGLGRMSYAISVTSETFIDGLCSLPYFQCYFHMVVDSVHALLSDEREDFILLTMKPVKLSFSQGVESASEDGRRSGDEQLFEFSISVIQIDDERACAKECVVAQLVENKPSTICFTRKLLRVAPIMYFKDFEINITPVEVHLEDSFLFRAMNYCERMRLAMGGGAGKGGGGGDAASSTSGDGNVNAMRTHASTFPRMEGGAFGRKRQSAGDAWKFYVIFIDHLLIEQVTLSISLYRSPGEENDPMWDRIGYLSLFINSVRDVRFVWRRMEQWGVYEALWLLGVSYSSYYKHQLLQQMPNVVHVAGLDMMRGFVTDLLQGYFSTAVVTHIDRTKIRLGRRSEARFERDEVLSLDTFPIEATQCLHGSFGERADKTSRQLLAKGTKRSLMDPLKEDQMHQVSQGSDAVLTLQHPAAHCSSTPLLGTKSRVIEAALRLPWSAFCARVSDEELREYGVFAVQRFLRTLDFANPHRMQWQMEDLVVGSAVFKKLEDTGSCKRCVDIDLMRAQQFESDDPSALPHPTSGLLTWAEFAHHVSWSEFVQTCSSSEVRKYAGMVLRFIVGQPMNMLRIDVSNGGGDS